MSAKNNTMKLVTFLFSAFVIITEISAFNYVKKGEIPDYSVKRIDNETSYDIPKTAIRNDGSAPLNLYQLAIKLNLTLFAKALTLSNLHKIIDHEGPFTVFAPTNEAFIKAPKYCHNVPLADRMKYHITRGKTTLEVFANDQQLWTLLSKRYVRINLYKGTNKVTASGREIIRPDNVATNGIIHVIKDEICSIYKGGAMFEINRCPDFRNFTYGVNSTGLYDTINSVDALTVFVPTDEAVGALPSSVVHRLVSDKAFRKKVVLNHVVPKTIFKAGMFQGQVLKTASGKKIRLSVKNDAVVIDGHSKIILADAAVKNGAVHSIDQVILPDKMKVELEHNAA